MKEHIHEGAPLNESDHCGDPPLILAAGNGHLAVVNLLLEEGADIEQRCVYRLMEEGGRGGMRLSSAVGLAMSIPVDLASVMDSC